MSYEEYIMHVALTEPSINAPDSSRSLREKIEWVVWMDYITDSYIEYLMDYDNKVDDLIFVEN